ncbi:divalent-cation tolerance protein CutA [Ktedonobacter robiniae]|uniref:Divalent cation tolerance protein n=1 Tax=Ktedonobacter robiniae TaxID=2778365 RepID=A0ABQ3V267_9CHLR|nr:divalent-cation tolerance protein CutA [Ktedonobacter robiniae]GHO59256.1 divalent cation tolerance protein [Ktedonobacter robiniae]
MNEYILVHTSIDSEQAAHQLADTIVSQRLAACGWVLGPITSSYWWQGKHEHAQEWMVQFKTRQALYGELEQAIRKIHSYDTPEIVATAIQAGSPAFLAWIDQETTK